MKTEDRNILIVVALIAVTAAILAGVAGMRPALGAAPNGSPANIATSTNDTLSATTVYGVIASSTCTARIISTGGSAVMLTFNDRDTPTGSSGNQQAASTTVVYDSGQYGCGKVKAYSFAASVITVTDSR